MQQEHEFIVMEFQNVKKSTRREFEEMEHQLYSSDSDVRLRGIRMLARYRRKEAREKLTGLLSDSDVRVRCAAILGVLKQKAREAIPALRELIHDPDDDVKWFAIHALGELDDSSGSLIFRMLEDVSSRVRITACHAIGQLAYTPALPSVRVLMTDPDPAVRAQACWTLGAMGDHASEEYLLKAGEDNEVNVRFEAGGALLKLGNHHGRVILEDILAKKEAPDFIKVTYFLRTVRRILAGRES